MRLHAVLTAAVLLSPLMTAGAAWANDPLMGRSPWNFSYQNRAAVAVAIKNAEDPAGNGNGAGTIVCGGTSGASGEGSNGSGASAGANSSCIIINNSAGATVHNDQYSHGNQTATSEANTNSGTVNGGRPRRSGAPASTQGGSIDEVAAVLNGHRQGL